jgi:hypothetical protein
MVIRKSDDVWWWQAPTYNEKLYYSLENVMSDYKVVTRELRQDTSMIEFIFNSPFPKGEAHSTFK